jgi:uncharacterized protein
MEPKGMTAVLEASSLVVDVSELLRHPGMTRPFRTTEGVSGLHLSLADAEGYPVTFDLALHSIVEGILVTGALFGRMKVECRRCLTEQVREFNVVVDEIFARGASADDDTYRVAQEHIDLEPMARDAIVLSLPLNPLCRDDCKGLCPTCGQNLNDADCGHATMRGDVRWEPLRRLMDQMGE